MTNWMPISISTAVTEIKEKIIFILIRKKRTIVIFFCLLHQLKKKKERLDPSLDR